MKNKLLFLLTFLLPIYTFAQCLEDIPGLVWKSNDHKISYEELALHVAPMLWFSPDEIQLYDETGHKQLPNAFPFEKQANQPVVYYKIRNVYATSKDQSVLHNSPNSNLNVLDLKQVKAIDLDYYYYFLEETGLGSHPHDIESITLQIRVLEVIDCQLFNYAIIVKKVTGRAHGLHWYNNELKVDAQTFFPLSILIEEGKHASCTDKNADGIYTPTFDVSEKVNDAWGIRDIITSGRLVTSGFQAWMAKPRNQSSIVFPPFPESSIHYKKYIKKFGDYIVGSQYELRPYPDYEALKKANKIAEKLDQLMRGKKPHDWPKIDKVTQKGAVMQWAKSTNPSYSFAYRRDNARQLSVAFPLLLIKDVEAPMTGGWIYNKFYIGPKNSFIGDGTFAYSKLLGHQLVHSSSASRWLDTYVGLGYEIYNQNFDPDEKDYNTFFVSEIGLKIRLNVSSTPLKFLKVFGTKFWGVRLGWKNVGFSNFDNSGFVLELGAGVF